MADDQVSDDGSLDSELEWELDEGIPQPDEPFMLKFFAGRKALIEQEKKQRHDRNFKQTMSPIAQQAASIMAAIRRRELKEKWSNEFQDGLAEQNDVGIFPGMMYSLARERMETTDLWKILEKMPKGALLHAHLDGMIDSGWLIDQLSLERGMCMVAEEGLSDKTKRTLEPFSFRYATDEEINAASGVDIWKAMYTKGTPVPVMDARRNFPDDDTTFKKWLISRMTITAEESICHHQGLDSVWKKFQSCFPLLDSILFYEPLFRKAFARLLGQLAADGVTYVDFRAVFRGGFILKGKTKPEKGYASWFKVFNEEIENFKATEAGKKFQGARMIWTVIRRSGNKDLVESMKECITLKKKYPKLICGFDCVGQEDTGRTLQDLTPMLFWFKKKCHEAGVEIPFFFHAGECLGDGDSTDNNLFDAILLGTRRIGHGFSLYKHPLLIDMVKERKILVESCPISNEVLRLSSSILSHSMPALLSRGVPVSLNNDDPAILGTGKNGMTPDFWQAFMGFENLGLEGLATMAENSLKWSAVEDQTQPQWLKGITDSYLGKTVKAKMLREWRTDFEKWCQWIIMEYPLETNDEDEVESEEEDDDEDEEDEEDDEDDE